MTKSIVAIALISVTAGISFTANAADMIGSYEPQPAYVVAERPQYARCDELVVEYRHPYVPHTEIVRFCDGYQPHVVARN
ncbi:hypothetical protein ASG42_25260 [Rhizobium sp. Leaf391]|uniref:hypothetical protein n=1 Tax=Rhizobium sp. Leaf391 TaxID=1736360 RepID=UPI0007128B5B|nr:hypothetical protein [Rhizobium sp. Leaf391]KQT02808.1 hypothetical protein ASG42_25260 [Rhizobium sp. Leaf391]